MTTPPRDRAEVGDLVRDTASGAVGVLTDVRDGVPILRPRYGAGFAGHWPAEWRALVVVSRRGTWSWP